MLHLLVCSKVEFVCCIAVASGIPLFAFTLVIIVCCIGT